MGYEVIERLIPPSKYPIKATHPMTPQWITLHNTANDATAANEIAYMTRNNNYTSYHVAIDDKQAIQAIPFSRNAWHCGDGQGNGNRRSIGIEICYSKSGGNRYTQAEANAIDYTAKLLKRFGWGIDRVRWHRDWSGKKCPHRIIDEGRLQQVKNRIEQRLKELNNPKKEEQKLHKPSTATLKNATIAYLRKATKDGVLTSDSWVKKAEAGTLLESDLAALRIIIDQRGK